MVASHCRGNSAVRGGTRSWRRVTMGRQLKGQSDNGLIFEGRMSSDQRDTPASRGWPKGVKPITINALDLLGIDSRLRLHWDGRPVEVRRALTRWQTLWAVVVGAFLVASSTASITQAYIAWLEHVSRGH